MNLYVLPQTDLFVNAILRELVDPLREYLAGRWYGESVIDFRAVPRISRIEPLGSSDTKDGSTRYFPKHQSLLVIRDIDYETFRTASALEQMSLMAECLRRIFSESDQMRRKPKDFDKERLVADIEEFLRSKGL